MHFLKLSESLFVGSICLLIPFIFLLQVVQMISRANQSERFNLSTGLICRPDLVFSVVYFLSQLLPTALVSLAIMLLKILKDRSTCPLLAEWYGVVNTLCECRLSQSSWRCFAVKVVALSDNKWHGGPTFVTICSTNNSANSLAVVERVGTLTIYFVKQSMKFAT